MQIFTELNPHCRRVLGALLEKEQTTPDYYPLTLNALISACNQTTNRNPVMTLKRYEVLAALHEMERLDLVQRVTGPRADRWRHLLIQRLLSEPQNKAILTVLMLRGAQTVGELKSRTNRMFSFESRSAVEEILLEFSEGDTPLVRELERQPGQKESRWELNLAQDDQPARIVSPVSDHRDDESDQASLEARVEKLEHQIEEILSRLNQIEG